MGKLHFYIVKSDVTVFYDVKSNVKLFYNVKNDVKLFYNVKNDVKLFYNVKVHCKTFYIVNSILHRKKRCKPILHCKVYCKIYCSSETFTRSLKFSPHTETFTRSQNCSKRPFYKIFGDIFNSTL